MNGPFILTIEYKGAEKNYSGELLLQGYSHKIKVAVDDTDVYFEPDDQGGYRVIAVPGQDIQALEKIDKHLLSLLHDKIQEVLQ
jgi:hypothetical protein